MFNILKKKFFYYNLGIFLLVYKVGPSYLNKDSMNSVISQTLLNSNIFSVEKYSYYRELAKLSIAPRWGLYRY